MEARPAAVARNDLAQIPSGEAPTIAIILKPGIPGKPATYNKGFAGQDW